MSSDRVAGWKYFFPALVAWLAWFPLPSAAQPPAAVPEESYPGLTAELEPLRAQFNQDAGKVRLLLLLDPT